MKKVFISFLIVVCLFIFNTACGLDVLYVIESPNANTVLSASLEPNERTFKFTTNESVSIEGIMLVGTDVYYKIYDNLDKLQSDVSYINSTDNNVSSRDRLISGGKNYKTLGASGYSASPLIKYTGSNRSIEIRLTDYHINSGSPYYSGIWINGENLNNSQNRVVPIRNISENDRNRFNFGRDTDSRKPLSDDSDSNVTSNSEEGIYYVSMFAVTVGHDTAYTNYYSEPAYLGYVKIDSNYPDDN